MNKTIPLMFVSLLLLAGCSNERDFGNVDMSDAAVKARIAPVGQVNIEGQTQAEAPMEKATPVEEKAPAAAPVAQASRSAKTIYQNSCFACHGTGAAGAPKFGDAVAWAPRAAMGIDALLASAKAGKGAMPPKGMCMDCADDELKATIEYMLNNSK